MTYTTYKRWTLLPDASLGEVAALVSDEIAPHYARLSRDVALALEAVAGNRSVLAILRWRDKATYDAALTSVGYSDWLERYQPTLERWAELVSFDAEWSTERLL